MTGKLVNYLLAHVESVFAGPNGDYPAVLEALEGIPAEKALWKPEGSGNSIWQITDHLTDSKRWQMDMLEKGQAAPPVWFEPSGGEADWSACINRLKEKHASYRAALASLTDEELLSTPGNDEKTLFELLLSSAAHEACHAGQIDYLKGLPHPS